VTSACVDINADLGEGGPSDHELLQLVTSASIACAYHAGDPATMLATAQAAARLGVAVGAHPSYADKENFGRLRIEVPAERIYADVLSDLETVSVSNRSTSPTHTGW
jgi:5-oxoprolinase (ATP-hydrolysing) subunit A